MNDTQKIISLVQELNEHRHAYYNLSAPTITDKEYDKLFDELQRLESETGLLLSNSPTQTVGYYPVSNLPKVQHPIPLLSLEKTKQVSELAALLARSQALLMLKLDGLTTKLVYEDGKLMQASTRGDGETGEEITHNLPAYQNVPLSIPYKKRLVITGESYIHTHDFERLKEILLDSNGKKFHNARNLVSGTVRNLNPKTCAERCVHFSPFNVLEGFEESPYSDSRQIRLSLLKDLGFDTCPYVAVEGPAPSEEMVASCIDSLVAEAAKRNLPIDGIVAIFDSFRYSKSCGKTGHHYKDGLAYKFEDEQYETILREIEWTPTRSGEIAPVGIFDTVEIDGCDVSRASLHNPGFIRNLELVPGCRILVSKRNMIIPHIEENLDRGKYQDIVPPLCPCCRSATRIRKRKICYGKIIETVHCDNPACGSQVLRKFEHFTSKKAMNIEGLSEATLERFLDLGYLNSFQDLYHLDQYREKIIRMEGFGKRSYNRLWNSITQSRKTDFVHFLVAMDIPMIGRTKSRILDAVFSGSLDDFEAAASGHYDFTALEDFGETLNHNIHAWFSNEENLNLWTELQKELTFNSKEEYTMTREVKENPFMGRTVVATGKLAHFTREGINTKILELGGKPGSSVTKKTDYLICGEKAGSKLKKALELNIPILTEEQFLEMIA